jgi:hypothetical protein
MTMGDDDRPMTAASREEDDAAWLAALAGRSTSAADRRAAIDEGAMMRHALRTWTPEIDAIASRDPERLARLIERARAEGLFDEREYPAQRPRRPGFFTGLRRWWDADAGGWPRRRALAMAAAIVLVAGVVFVMKPADRRVDDDQVVRSAQELVLLQANDPQALQRQLIDALAKEGVKATGYSRFGRYGIDADLPQNLAPSLRALLERNRIHVPGDGVLRVEIEATRR